MGSVLGSRFIYTQTCYNGILYTHLTTVHPALGEKKGTNFKGRCLTRFNRLHAWPEEIPRYECLD